jgi:hypothetical protein
MANEIPTKIVINCSTGVREVLELTQAEIDEREAMATEAEAQRLVDEQAKANAEAVRQSGLDKLIALGLTKAEALALVGA